MSEQSEVALAIEKLNVSLGRLCSTMETLGRRLEETRGAIQTLYSLRAEARRPPPPPPPPASADPRLK